MDSSSCTDLPSDVLSIVSTFLTKNSDYVQFRSVCTEWRRAAVPEPQLPLILLDGLRLCPTSTFILEPNADLLCGVSAGERCYASSHGWLVLAGGGSHDVVLFNPITRTKISVPPLTSRPDFHPRGLGRFGFFVEGDFTIKRIVLSSNPSLDDNFTAMAIITSTSVGFWRRGQDKTWITTDGLARILDISHSDKLFYSLHDHGRVIVWDEESRTQIETLSLENIMRENQCYLFKNYLVMTSDGLLVVVRYTKSAVFCVDESEANTWFEVYQIDFDFTGGAITRLRALTNRALFVGELSCLVVPSAASGFPKQNSVYFVDYSRQKYWMKVFDLVDGSREVLAEVDMYRARIFFNLL